ncbi:MAG: hypothetical protein Fur0037_03360 [Planctomycetota bacterium]
MSPPFLSVRLFLALAAPALSAAAQSVTVPDLAGTLPGNAAMSMPLRWSQGTLQVILDQSLIPAAARGGIRGLHLRRPALLGEPPYQALTRTLTVRAGTTRAPARAVQWTLSANQPANLQTVFGPAQVQIAPSLGPGPSGVLGAELLAIPFSTPIALPVAGDNLFLEFETTDSGLAVDPGNWVDAVWFTGGADGGYAATAGEGGCGGSTTPTTLRWDSASMPRRGASARLLFESGFPEAFALALVSMSPQTRAPGPSFLGFGADLSSLGLQGCYQWSAPDAVLFGQTTVVGSWQVDFSVPTAHLNAGDRLGVQVAVLAPGANPLGFALSNGVVLVLDQAGVGDHGASVFFPGAATPSSVTPWPPFVGLLPVLVLDY